MVLVLPAHRRKGHASKLLRTAIADLETRRLTPILDATPAGRAVYSQEGFAERWSFKRYFRMVNKSARPAGEARPIHDGDWNEILELDREAFGATREALLRNLFRRLPQAAWIVPGKGFVLGRDGREAHQLGPLVSGDEKSAKTLLTHALAAIERPVYVDACDHAQWGGILEAAGFAFQRPFTRMVRGERPAPGRQKLTFLVAGPELG
jgi:hypothetical protein